MLWATGINTEKRKNEMTGKELREKRSALQAEDQNCRSHTEKKKKEQKTKKKKKDKKKNIT